MSLRTEQCIGPRPLSAVALLCTNMFHHVPAKGIDRISEPFPLVHLITTLCCHQTCMNASSPAGALTRPVRRPSDPCSSSSRSSINGAIIVRRWSQASFRIGHALSALASFDLYYYLIMHPDWTQIISTNTSMTTVYSWISSSAVKCAATVHAPLLFALDTEIKWVACHPLHPTLLYLSHHGRAGGQHSAASWYQPAAEQRTSDPPDPTTIDSHLLYGSPATRRPMRTHLLLPEEVVRYDTCAYLRSLARTTATGLMERLYERGHGIRLSPGSRLQYPGSAMLPRTRPLSRPRPAGSLERAPPLRLSSRSAQLGRTFAGCGIGRLECAPPPRTSSPPPDPTEQTTQAKLRYATGLGQSSASSPPRCATRP